MHIYVYETNRDQFEKKTQKQKKNVNQQMYTKTHAFTVRNYIFLCYYYNYIIMQYIHMHTFLSSGISLYSMSFIIFMI